MIISMNFLVPSAVHQIHLTSHFCSPDHPEYITVSRRRRQDEPTINGFNVTCTTIPTMHACLARTRMRATLPKSLISRHSSRLPRIVGQWSKYYNEVLNIWNIWKTTVFVVLSAVGQVVVDTVFSKVGTAVCWLQEHSYAGRKNAWGRNYWKMQLEKSLKLEVATNYPCNPCLWKEICAP